MREIGMLRLIQCVRPAGVLFSVMQTACLIFSMLKGFLRDGRVAPFNSPAIPPTYKIHGSDDLR